MPLYLSDYLDICDPVLVFDRFMKGIDLEKYLKHVPKHTTGRIRYNPANMLKAILFGFMSDGYISLRELEDNCKVNLRYMYIMDHQTPSYRTFGYFIENILCSSVEDLFCDINKKIVGEEHVDLSHLYIDGSKFKANANTYSWVWKKSTEKFRYKLYEKITRLFHEMNEELTSMHQEVVDNLESIHGALLRMNRSIQSEGTFGIMKNNRWYQRIVRKGMKQVRLEIFLVSIGHNLYKYHRKKLRLKKAA